MAKPERLHVPGHRHFVTFSTYKRRKYLVPDATKNIILEVLQKVLQTHAAQCSGFVVMPDHVHAILFGDENFNISRIVQVWKKTTSYRIHEFYKLEFSRYSESVKSDDPVWQAGFNDYNIESPKEENVRLDYMHANPVEAKLVDDACEWAWSSARFYEMGEPVGYADCGCLKYSVASCAVMNVFITAPGQPVVRATLLSVLPKPPTFCLVEGQSCPY